MTAYLTVESRSETLLRLMADLARNLGCETDDGEIASSRFVRIEMPAGSGDTIGLLSHLALSAKKAGVHIDEPLCHVTVPHSDRASVVTLSMRLMQCDVKAASSSHA